MVKGRLKDGVSAESADAEARVIAGALVLLAMTAVAAYVPARRAARLDPLTVLKQD